MLAMSDSIAGNDTALAGGIIDIRLPITVAKFINNCSLLLLLLNKVTSIETMAEPCTGADC